MVSCEQRAARERAALPQAFWGAGRDGGTDGGVMSEAGEVAGGGREEGVGKNQYCCRVKASFRGKEGIRRRWRGKEGGGDR